MITLPSLEAREDLDELVYHFKGLIEAVDEISRQMKLLDSSLDSDPEGAADAMGALEAQIYTHLTYHMKELRKPFVRFFRDSTRALAKRGGPI